MNSPQRLEQWKLETIMCHDGGERHPVILKEKIKSGRSENETDFPTFLIHRVIPTGNALQKCSVRPLSHVTTSRSPLCDTDKCENVHNHPWLFKKTAPCCSRRKA